MSNMLLNKSVLRKFSGRCENFCETKHNSELWPIFAECKNFRQKQKFKKSECRIKNILYLVHHAVDVPGKVHLSAKAPKLYVKLRTFVKFLQKIIGGDNVSKSFGKYFWAKNYVQIVYLAHQQLHGFRWILLVAENRIIT